MYKVYAMEHGIELRGYGVDHEEQYGVYVAGRLVTTNAAGQAERSAYYSLVENQYLELTGRGDEIERAPIETD